ncbi:MAG: LLM class flavin-dependent oxidoreductase, partial [Geodermatophilales bacterium]|nr:LLM class flavin-dependent oxidoreductase [Geodermatophilales bacterium]
TVWGDVGAGRIALDAWYGAGAEMPVLVLPPGRNLDELDLVLDALRPSGRPRDRAARALT